MSAKRPLPWITGLLLAIVGVACSSSRPAANSATAASQAAPVALAVVQPGAPGQASTVIADNKVPAFHDANYTTADVDFMQGMIHHHMQALQMVALIPSHTQNQQVRMLGTKIQISQSQEIKGMQVWLTQRAQALPVMSAAGMTLNGKPMPLMSGMLSPAQMKALQAAHGSEFDRLFLVDMIQHHSGALEMVADLRSQGGALEPNIANFATDVYTSQKIQIERMNGLLGRSAQ